MIKSRYIKVCLAGFAACVILLGCGQTTEQQVQETTVQENTTQITDMKEPESNENQAVESETESEHPEQTAVIEGASDSSTTESAPPDKNENTSGIKDMLNDYYADYKATGGKIAYVTDVSQMEDGTFNQTVYDGIRLYANSAGVTYSYYIAQEDSPEEYERLVEEAISTGGKLIVSSGVHFEQAIGAYQYQYPNVYFLMIDGTPKDEEGQELTPETNVHCVTFREEESAYLAGYFTVLDGYRKLGFIGGDQVPPVIRYGYGYLAGINEAAKDLECTDDIQVNYWYSGSFLATDDVKKMAEDWYHNGCEVIFACGGSLYESVLEAADEADKKIIGVDVDQSPISERFLTSAIKGVDRAVVKALDDFFAYGKWSEDLGGHISNYGISEWCGGLPTMTWNFEETTTTKYGELYLGIKEGSIVVSHDIDSFPITTVKVHNYDE